jgi:hypothetical protein
MSTSGVKKRKTPDTVASSGNGNKKVKSEKDENAFSYETFTLEDIRSKIQLLCRRVPEIPENNFARSGSDNADDLDEVAIKDWAAELQEVLEEFNLLVCCVATATYKWGTDRSGAGDQNLSLLSGELGSSQEQIASAVTPRLTNVLAPVVDLVIERVVKTKDANGNEIKENHFTRKLVDPDFVKLCNVILVRNAPLLRRVVLSNFSKLLQVLKDYLKAQTNDTQHSRSFTY